MTLSVLDIHAHYIPRKLDGQSIISLSVGEPMPEWKDCEPGLFLSVGLHPWQVTQGWEHLVGSLLLPWVEDSRVVAVGEAGLDYLRSSDRELQMAAFTRQARLAEEYGKPLIVHCVKAWDDLVCLHRRLAPSVPWILHGFRGKAIQAAQMLREGFYLSFGEHYHAEALGACPTDRLFMESDESRVGLPSLYQRAAEVRGVPTEELMAQVRENIERVFGV